MAKLTPQQRITRASVQLMRSKQFCLLSGILVMGKREIKECGTAMTNGRDTYFDPNFIETLTEKQLNFLTAHEAWHIALKQLTTYKNLWKQNPQLCNMAADYVANQMIMDADPNGEVVEFIEGGCLDEKYRGWNTKQVFDDLLKNPPPEGGSGSGSGKPLDEHDFESGSELTEQEKQALEKAVDEALRQGTLLAGKMGGNVSREIKNLLEPKVDWREELRDFVAAISNDKELSTWRKPNRRHLGAGVYLPSMFSETVGDIVVGIDTSGSIGNDELSQFLGEVQKICELTNPSKLHILWWDTKVAGVDEFSQGDYDGLASRVKPAGGGGTDVSCVFDYVAEHGLKPEAAIILSDLYTPWCAAPSYPVLFAANTREVAPFGKTVRID